MIDKLPIDEAAETEGVKLRSLTPSDGTIQSVSPPAGLPSEIAGPFGECRSRCGWLA
jgi:hypothetical protein